MFQNRKIYKVNNLKKKMDKQLKEEIKTFLKFVEECYWSDTMTHSISRKLREKLK